MRCLPLPPTSTDPRPADPPTHGATPDSNSNSNAVKMKSLVVLVAGLAVATAQEQLYADPAAAVPGVGAADYYSGECRPIGQKRGEFQSAKAVSKSKDPVGIFDRPKRCFLEREY